MSADSTDVVSLAFEIQQFLLAKQVNQFDALAALLVLSGTLAQRAVDNGGPAIPACVHDLISSIRLVLEILNAPTESVH